MTTDLITVQTIQEVSALLALPNSRIRSGGTCAQHTDGSLQLIDISGLEGLDGIKQKGNRIETGALTKLSALAGSALLQNYAPALAQAAAEAGTPEIREQGTLGGNLAAAYIGDTAAALLAIGAKLTIKTDNDYRELLLDRFWDQNGQNALQYDEWITRITIQQPKGTYWGQAFGKSGEWDLLTGPAAAAAINLTLNENHVITSIRGALRPGAHAISRMFPLEKTLKNHPATQETIEKAVRVTVPQVRSHIKEEDFIEFLTDIIRRAVTMAEERRIP